MQSSCCRAPPSLFVFFWGVLEWRGFLKGFSPEEFDLNNRCIRTVSIRGYTYHQRKLPYRTVIQGISLVLYLYEYPYG